jgi:hypothetical protein
MSSYDWRAFHVVDDKVMRNLLSKLAFVMNNSSVQIFNDFLLILSHGNQFGPETRKSIG